MDIIAHALWTGAAAQAIRTRKPLARREIVATVALGVAPDVIQLLPILFWSFSQPDPIRLLRDYITATPGNEPIIPPIVHLLSHHLHCATHSAVIAAVVTLVLWRIRGSFWIPLAGWWLHIALDIPTHSNDYYAVPFLYPLTYWGFNGIAWTEPWFMATNYAAIVATYAILFAKARRKVDR